MPSEHRLHPMSVLFSIGSALRSFVIPAILVLFAAPTRRFDAFLMVLILPSGVVALVRYLSYRYIYAEEELIIRTGFIFRNERHIPYARIHNIGAVQNLFHRLFGVVEVKIETAGGVEPEARLQVLSVRAMEELRRHVLSRKGLSASVAAAGAPSGITAEAPAAAPAPKTLLRLPPSELMVYGIIENRGMVVVGAAVGLAWELGWLGDSAGAPSGLFRSWTSLLGGLSSRFEERIVFVAALAILFLVLLRVFSIGWAFFKFFDFRLQRTERDLTTSAGLFTRVTATIPLHRIQVLTIREKPLHRLFGRAEVRVETAGGGGNDADQSARGPQWLAPVIRSRRLFDLLGEVMPEIDLRAVEWQRIDPRARRRIFRVSLFLIAIVTAMAALSLAWWALLVPALLVPLAAINARLQVRNMGFALVSGVVLYRSGWLWRRTSMARFSKIQALALHEGPFDRRYRMAELRLDTAGAGSAGHRLAIPYLDMTVARRLFDRLGSAAARTAFSW